MEFTGERLVPGRDDLKDLYHEHVSRYLLASRLCAERRVLDLGCGCGYGSDLLAARGAKHVTGVDLSPEAIDYCLKHYGRAGLDFRVMDATALDFADGSFDAVVSFEVLEHLGDHDAFLAEAKRVLKDGGLFVVSTPNTDWRDHGGGREDNPFHVKELTRAQFESALERRFANVTILAQRRVSGVEFAYSPDAAQDTDRDLASDGVPEYFLAICSDAGLPETAGLFVEVPYYQNLRELTGHLTAKDEEIADKGERIEALQDEIGEKTAWATKLDADLADEHKRATRLEIETIHLKEELTAAKATLGYRVHQKLRPLAHKLRDIAAAAPKAILALVRLIVAVPAVAILLLAKVPEAVLTLLFAPAALVHFGVALSARFAKRRPSATEKPARRSPDGVSVVIPSWNAKDLLARYLPHLRDALRDAAFDWEVIVVDNGSEDGSAAFVESEFPLFRVLSLGDNRGFSEGVNAGAEIAQYRILYTLNNDMEVAPDFLDEVLPLFDDPDVFAVTSRIDFPEGKRRQESGLATGRVAGGRLEIHHRFDVDDEVWPTLYAGGGSSAFDRDRFVAMGGFDPLYQPFYVEDLDLSYRAWKRGLKVLYQPASRVVHQHRGTIGKHHDEGRLDRIFAANLLTFAWRNLSAGPLSMRLGLHLPNRIARAILGERNQVPWRALLDAAKRLPVTLARIREEPEPVMADDEVLRVSGSRFAFRERFDAPRTRRKGGRLGVLFVSPYCPYPPSHGGAVRMYNLMRQVAREHDVYLASMIEYEKERGNEAHLREFCKDVALHLRTPPAQTGFLDPASVQEFYSDEFARIIDRMLGANDIDVIQMEYTTLAHFLPRSNRLRSVVTEIDLYYVTYLRRARSRRSLVERLLGYYEYLRMFRYEMNACDRYDLVLAMSAHDKKTLSEYVPADKIAVVRNGVDLDAHPLRAKDPESEDLLFVGHFRHEPNIDSILWFCGEVWPRVRKRFPRAKLTIAGAGAPDAVNALGQRDGITVAGFVDDLTPLYEKTAVFLAPITRGSGTRLKIVEAMARGVPVVSTTLGAEGLHVTDGEDILIADAPQGYADAIERVLEDAELRGRLVQAGRSLAEREYDWRAIADGLMEEYDRLVSGGEGE